MSDGRRPTHAQARHTRIVDTSPAARPRRVKLTPPCVCRYPLIKSDRVCPRCERPNPNFEPKAAPDA